MAARVAFTSVGARLAIMIVFVLLTGLIQRHVTANSAQRRATQALTNAKKSAPPGPAKSSPTAKPHLPAMAGVSSDAEARHFVDYELSVSLDPAARTLNGSALLLLTNTSQRPLTELYFHLYLNAFSHKNTQFLRKGRARSGRRLGAPGSVDVHSLTSPFFGETNLWDKADPHSPGDPDDETDIRVPLPAPIVPGATIQFRLTFTTLIPQMVERSGVERDFFLMGQWFPKLAKLEPQGTFRHFAYHPAGEFYADFANYVVHLDVPENYVVGSTGRLDKQRDNPPGRALYRAEAHNVVDFAWTAWPQFQKTEARLGGVRVHVLGPERTDALRSATLRTVAQGLVYLGERLGDYPYSDLTVVIPPYFAGPAEGMEYPQFITTRSSVTAPFFGARIVELITIHELIHQWFQSVVASDEMTFPFLDESLTSFLEWTYMDQQLVPPGVSDWSALSVSRAALGRFLYYSQLRQGQKSAKIASSVEELGHFDELAQVIYGRAPLSLWTLGHAMGDPHLSRVLARYAARFRFGHPTIVDFLSVVEEELGTAAREQARLMLYENAALDLRLGEVKSTLREGTYDSTIVVIHDGALTLEYKVRLTFEDGSSLIQTEISDRPTKEYRVRHRSALVRVELDPDHHNLLDANLLDNSRSFTRAQLKTHELPAALPPNESRRRSSSVLFSVINWLLLWGAA